MTQEKEAAETVSRAKSDFLSVMDHVIRTPIDSKLATLRNEAVSVPAGSESGAKRTTPADALVPGFDFDAEDEPLVQRLIALFFERSPLEVEAIERAYQAGDWATLARLAHAFQGTLRIFRPQDAFDAARQLESMAANGQVDGLEAVLEKLSEGVRQVGETLTPFRPE